jgi:hypothetical protein
VGARLVRVDDIAPQRRRNGGGLTRELFTWPSADAWRLRVSVADVAADGPFSSFPDVERWFAVIDGHGVELTIDGTPHRLTAAGVPLRFHGAAPAACRLLDGPTRDLNLMLRDARGSMFRAMADQPWRPDAAQCGLFATVAGQCVADDVIDMPARSLLRFDVAPASLRFLCASATAGAIGWWLAASPRETNRCP